MEINKGDNKFCNTLSPPSFLPDVCMRVCVVMSWGSHNNTFFPSRHALRTVAQFMPQRPHKGQFWKVRAIDTFTVL